MKVADRRQGPGQPRRARDRLYGHDGQTVHSRAGGHRWMCARDGGSGSGRAAIGGRGLACCTQCPDCRSPGPGHTATSPPQAPCRWASARCNPARHRSPRSTRSPWRRPRRPSGPCWPTHRVGRTGTPRAGGCTARPRPLPAGATFDWKAHPVSLHSVVNEWVPLRAATARFPGICCDRRGQ